MHSIDWRNHQCFVDSADQHKGWERLAEKRDAARLHRLQLKPLILHGSNEDHRKLDPEGSEAVQWLNTGLPTQVHIEHNTANLAYIGTAEEASADE